MQSAKNVMEALDKDKYEPILVGIDKSGKWYFQDQANYLLNASNPKLIALNKQNAQEVALVPGDTSKELISLEAKQEKSIDVAFPVMHGTYGEDGAIQGLLKMMDIPFVGASVLGSAVGMDKDVMKRLFKESGVPTPKFLVFRKEDKIDFDKVVHGLGMPVFVKPANAGSSVGVHKVKTEEDFEAAIKDAFQFDNKILIEEAIVGREIECSVLGNENPEASVPGEVIPHHEFYSYEAKYIDENGAVLEIPAKLTPELVKQIQGVAIKAYKSLCLEGMSRVDCFLTKDNEILVNEVNTIPGFTKISMYPKLWEASGLPYGQLIDKLIQLALERHKKEKGLKTNYD